jgi:NAD(P)-dependent dehydrogenase (short-subunit alcohol dehydrogenase family)
MPTGRTILITGAARGIGRELVRRAVARNDRVFAVVRKEADRARFEAAPNLQVVLMDVAVSASVAAGFAEVDRLLAGQPLDAIVHAAAISRPSAIEIAPVEEFEQILNTNTLGSLRVLKAAIPRLRGHGGRLILVTSLWGKASGALLGAYCASKHAIESLADTARRETAGMNLHVILAEPGVVLTDMLSTQAPEVEALIQRMTAQEHSLYESLYRRYAKLTSAAGGTAITSARCAADIEIALNARRPRTRYRIGRDAKVVCILNWLLPDRWMDSLMGLTLNRKPLTPGGKSG